MNRFRTAPEVLVSIVIFNRIRGTLPLDDERRNSARRPRAIHVLPASTAIAAVLALLLFSAGCGSRPATRVEWTFDDYYNAGLESFRTHNDAKAEHFFHLALQKNPRNAPANYYLAVLEAERGADDLATAGFQRAIELQPDFPEAYYNLGTLKLKRGEAIASAGFLEKAVAQRPDYAPAYVNLGKAYYLSNLPDRAGAAFKEALTRDPHNRAALENLIALAQSTGDSKAEETYRRRLGQLTE